MRRLFVLGNGQRPGVREEAAKLLPFLRTLAEVVVFDLEQKADLTGHDADMALVLGGDGAMLRAARQMGYRQLPMLGLNLGKLGFLAELGLEDSATVLPQVLANPLRATRHVMYECEVYQKTGKQVLLGLNEIVVYADPPLQLVEIDLTIDDEPVSTFSGDGLIISTPIGSTAHSLSAGGPILRQDLAAFVVTPLCAHTLTYRPLVEEARRTFHISLHPGTREALLIVDGQERIRIGPEDRILLRRAPVEFQLVCVPGSGYYRRLRDKLHWGEPPNYRERK
jgi:NAD+ kinase